MQESYSGSNRRIKLSSREIRKMKDNMKKVPEIQKKADSYHRFEEKEAEELLKDITENSSIKPTEYANTEKTSLREKIKLLFKKLTKNHNNLGLIQEKLPENLWGMAQTFTIDDNSLNQYSDLVVLILNSKSLSDNTEKQNWFNLLTIMNEEQIPKLKEILTREKEKIEEINTKDKEILEESYTKDKEILEEFYTKEKENLEKIYTKEKENLENILYQKKEKLENIYTKDKDNLEKSYTKEKEKIEEISIREKEKLENIYTKEKEILEEFYTKKKENLEEFYTKKKEILEKIYTIEKEEIEKIYIKEKENLEEFYTKKKEILEKMN